MLRLLALSVVAASVSCREGQPPPASLSVGSLAITSDGRTLYAAEPDLDEVVALDVASMAVVARLTIPGEPALIRVSGNDVFVVSRAANTLYRIPVGAQAPDASAEIPGEPVSIVVSSDGTSILVLNGVSKSDPTSGTLAALDSSSLTEKWELAVG